MNRNIFGFVKPHEIRLDGDVAVVTLPASGAVHRLTGASLAVAHHLLAGRTDPSRWNVEERQALEVLCELGVIRASGVSRRAVLASAAAVGITTLALPASLAAESPSGGGGGGGLQGTLEVLDAPGQTLPGTSTVAGFDVLRWTTAGSVTGSFNVFDGPVEIDYLIIGGGGGGGHTLGGGGGGAQVTVGNTTLAVGLYQVTVGDGGAPASSITGQGQTGGQSVLESSPAAQSWTAAGGGGGFSASSPGTPGVGGTGGGGTFAGGAPDGPNAGGGGGGADGNGGSGDYGGYGNGGEGGSGLNVIGFDGDPVWGEDYAGGGGGGGDEGYGEGFDGGGNGGSPMEIAQAGTANTGGGGGGGGPSYATPIGGAGGTGVVVIKTTATVTLPN